MWRQELLACVQHVELEECVAKFVGKQSAIVFGMGYVTNSSIIPVLIGKVCIIYICMLYVLSKNKCLK